MKLKADATFIHLSSLASEGLALVQGCHDVLRLLEIDITERKIVSLALLMASIDQARSACLLFSEKETESVFPALILFRSQVDQLTRGAFFAAPASDEELKHYLNEDELPTRDGDRLGPKGLSRIVEDHFKWPAETRYSDMVSNAWGVL